MSDFLLTLLVIFFLFSVFRRYILFFIINAITKGLHRNLRNMQQQQQQQAGNTAQNRDGYISVEDTRKGKKPSVSGDAGEYIDYEEIKD
jgi:hypothetical protein